jgi:hypothetical protein
MGFASLIQEHFQRYRAPIFVTETSARGAEDIRARWLEASVMAIGHLRDQGVPVLGYTWFPLFTMVDWRYRFGRGPLAEYLLELGLYSLDQRMGTPRWRPTPLVEQYRSYIADPEEIIRTFVIHAAPPQTGAEQ